MRKYKHHKYTWTHTFGVVRHNWELVGPYGALHFHVGIPDSGAYSPSAGLEVHYTSPPEGVRGQAPDHKDCPLTGGRCWHEGTSLYASEVLWPRVEGCLRAGDHDGVFRALEYEANSYFAEFEPEPTDGEAVA